MKRTPYRRAVLFERTLLCLFLGVGVSGFLSTYDSRFAPMFLALLLGVIFVGIWYGLITCPACGRPISWRRSRHEELSRKCRGCGTDLDS